MTSPKPTLLLVQGSFQLPEVYGKLVKALEGHGYPVVFPTLPSLTDQDGPDFASKSLADDARAVRNELQDLVARQGKKVVVIMHSYGGLVGTEAVPEDLSWNARNEQGEDGGVIHLFFFSAFILAKGQSVLGVFGESPANDIRPNGRFRIKDGGARLYSDLPPEEAQYWESKIIDQSYAVQTTQITREAYSYISSTYVVSEIDQAVPVQYQEMFAKAANAQLLRISAGHSPMLSKSAELADLIIAKAEAESRRTSMSGSIQHA